MTTPPSPTLEYAPPPPGPDLRMAARIGKIFLIALALIAALLFAPYAYTSAKFDGLQKGMTRVQAEQHLSNFAIIPNPTYQGISPGLVVIRYELMGLGKSASIQIVYNADGTILEAHPIYRH